VFDTFAPHHLLAHFRIFPMFTLGGSKQKTFNEKRGNPKMQGAQNKRHPIKKEVTLKGKGLKIKDL
jgi:hypothetical protein